MEDEAWLAAEYAARQVETPSPLPVGERSGANNMQVNTEAGSRPLDEVLATIERREILHALQRADGQRTMAARLLGISRSRLYRRMEALGIDPRKVMDGTQV